MPSKFWTSLDPSKMLLVLIISFCGFLRNSRQFFPFLYVLFVKLSRKNKGCHQYGKILSNFMSRVSQLENAPIVFHHSRRKYFSDNAERIQSAHFLSYAHGLIIQMAWEIDPPWSVCQCYQGGDYIFSVFNDGMYFRFNIVWIWSGLLITLVQRTEVGKFHCSIGSFYFKVYVSHILYYLRWPISSTLAKFPLFKSRRK